ncbi:unnamed protein product [Adineta ricciae]|uniref:F-box domain-containing protein n=1 Tax=Adineta ricciae TaxID=249248 RepID=A0A814MLC7_ADIRI|nr:unnamed protein product [Adineta ricciae]CAF1453961.1 unnamed protein product [Adineta ricciae]
MQLDSLPNELFLDVFKCLSTSDLLRAFSQLNTRFDRLILTHLQDHKCIDLRATAKYHVDLFWTQLLPPLVTQITSLTLSNDINTPNQIQQFYSHGFTLCQFTRLQTLSLSHVHSSETMDKILKDLSHLLTLSHLTFNTCNINHDWWVNIVWSLPKLVYFSFIPHSASRKHFYTPRLISSTIKSIHGFCDEYATSIIDLTKQTPQLRYLSISADNRQSFSDLSTYFNSITKLNLLFDSCKFNSLLNILRRIPNVTHLKVDMKSHCIDAQIWQRLIQKHMTKLKYLQFRMTFTVLANNIIIKQEVEKVVDSFRNPFWLDEHRWFVQCDWNPRSRKCYIYTVPYTFDSFNIDFQLYSKSTCAPDNAECHFECVRRLTFSTTSHTLHECLSLSHIHFSNIEHLTIELSRPNHFLYSNDQFNPLAYADEMNCLNLLKCVLEQNTHLTSLHFHRWPSAILNLSQCDIKNVLIFELNLRGSAGCDFYYTAQQCDQISRSTLGMQCRILTIDVKDLTCVYDLIMKMNNLQILDVRCRCDQPNSGEITIKENLREWLQNNIQIVPSDTRDPSRSTVADGSRLYIERL